MAQSNSGKIPAILEAGLISAINERVGFQYLVTREEAERNINETRLVLKNSDNQVAVAKPVTVSIENVFKNLYPYNLREDDQDDQSDVVFDFQALSIGDSRNEPSNSLVLARSSSNHDLVFELFVNNPMGKTHTYRLPVSSTVLQLKQLVEKVEFIQTQEQLLFFGGKELINEQKLISYDIKNNTTLFLVLQIKGGRSEMFTLDPNDFDPAFDYDFTNIKDETARYSRGGKRYRRPEGAKRYALKVLGKYKTDSDSWLSTSDRADVWPVAYHGTIKGNVESIIKEGLKLDKFSRFLYGKGIYCTPDPKVALGYGHEFQHEGKKYRLILQTRVHPTLHKCVKRDERLEEAIGEYWTVPDGEAIRPYGICIYPM